MIFKCPKCGTEYFLQLLECDWCPETQPIQLPEEGYIEEDQAVAA